MSLKGSTKSPPALEMYLGRHKQKGKKRHLDGIGADLQIQGRGPLSSSSYFRFFLKYCPKIHSFQ